MFDELLRDYCRLGPEEMKRIVDAGGDLITLLETPPSSLPGLCEACGLSGVFTKQRVVNGVARFVAERGSYGAASSRSRLDNEKSLGLART